MRTADILYLFRLVIDCVLNVVKAELYISKQYPLNILTQQEKNKQPPPPKKPQNTVSQKSGDNVAEDKHRAKGNESDGTENKIKIMCESITPIPGRGPEIWS